jgi:hypothetical protein
MRRTAGRNGFVSRTTELWYRSRLMTTTAQTREQQSVAPRLPRDARAGPADPDNDWVEPSRAPLVLPSLTPRQLHPGSQTVPDIERIKLRHATLCQRGTAAHSLPYRWRGCDMDGE